jgi:hypothetical protein
MARAALTWGVLALACEASISTQPIVRFERGEQLRSSTVAAIRDALEASGIEGVPENSGGEGVRFRRP